MTGAFIIAACLATQCGPGDCTFPARFVRAAYPSQPTVVTQANGDVKAWFTVVHEGRQKQVWGCQLSNGLIRWFPHEQPAEPAPAPAPSPTPDPSPQSPEPKPDDTEFPPRLWDGTPEDWARRRRDTKLNYGVDIDKLDAPRTLRASDPITLKAVQKVIADSEEGKRPLNPFKRTEQDVAFVATAAVAACLFLGGLVLLIRPRS